MPAPTAAAATARTMIQRRSTVLSNQAPKQGSIHPSSPPFLF
jgi:hypothetical protein